MKFITIDKDRWINIDRIGEVVLEKATDTLTGEIDVTWKVGVKIDKKLTVFDFQTEGAARDKLNAILGQTRK